jgi:hypothetical protein
MSTSSFGMRTLDCSAQRAAKKWGMQYYDCSSGGLKIRAGFFRGINARAKVQRIFTPTEAEPEGDRAAASCEWLVSLD